MTVLFVDLRTGSSTFAKLIRKGPEVSRFLSFNIFPPPFKIASKNYSKTLDDLKATK